MERVVVIGSGLAGLTLALRSAARAQVTLLEAAPRLGGQIWTAREHGFTVERGAEGFVFRSEAVPKLAAAAGLEGELIAQSVLKSYGFGPNGLVTLAPGEAATFLGFQVPREDLGKGIRSLRRGMGSLIDGLVNALQSKVELRANAAVARVEARDGAGARVVLASGETIEARAVIVATAARAAAELLQPLVGAPAAAMRQAPLLSSVTVELAFQRDALDHALDGTGFVVALDQQEQGLRACTFTTSKFAARAPEGAVSVRLFFRPTDEELATLDDETWTLRALAGLSRVLPVRSRPLAHWVTRWPDALPVHTPEHTSAVQALEAALAPYPVRVAGAAFHGSGIDAAVRSGEAAAEWLASTLAAPQGESPQAES